MPNLLSTIRGSHPLRPYYYGEHKWDNYLIDIQETIAGLSAPDPDVRQVSSGSGLGTLDDTLNSGFDALSVTLDELATGVKNLGAKFEWGFTLMIDSSEKQINLLNQIVGQLDAIREAVQLPSTTRAREFFALGQKDVQRGFLPEALKKFLAAERENEVNFPLQLQLGKLLLYGKNKSDGVIDLPKAEEHLLLAARYTGNEDRWREYRGESLFHAAIAAYLLGESEKLIGHTDAMRKCLERALTHSLNSIQSRGGPMHESCYLGTKCRALLGRKEEALRFLGVLAEDHPVVYAAKVDRDKDFDSIRTEAQAVFRQAAETARKESHQ